MKKMAYQRSTNTSEDISDNETCSYYLRESEPMPVNPSPNIQAFRAKIAEIQAAGMSKGLDYGEMITMISKNYNFQTWREIPYGKMNEIKMFLINNAFRKFEIMDLELHKKFSTEVPGYEKEYANSKPTTYQENW